MGHMSNEQLTNMWVNLWLMGSCRTYACNLTTRFMGWGLDWKFVKIGSTDRLIYQTRIWKEFWVDHRFLIEIFNWDLLGTWKLLWMLFPSTQHDTFYKVKCVSWLQTVMCIIPKEIKGVLTKALYCSLITSRDMYDSDLYLGYLWGK